MVYIFNLFKFPYIFFNKVSYGFAFLKHLLLHLFLSILSFCCYSKWHILLHGLYGYSLDIGKLVLFAYLNWNEYIIRSNE